MDVERATGVVRPRGQWEAVDFGFALTRAWRRPLWRAWLATAAPLWWAVYAGVTALAGPWWALLALWWLRPLLSRVPLLVLSRALFGEVVGARAALREAPRLWLRHFAGDLTLRRLDLARSFHLPIYQLEGLSGAARRRRLTALRQDRWGTAMALTGIAMVLEASAFSAALALAPLLTPEGLRVDWNLHFASLFRSDTAGWFLALVGACAFAALTLVEPFYVGGGFGLYLDRRTHLEGWDVELAFRRLARRIEAGRTRTAAAALAPLAAAAALLAAGAAHAAEPPPPPRDPTEAAREVLADADFATRAEVDTWRLREELFTDDRPRGEGFELPVGGLAAAGEILLWVLAAALLGLLVAAVVRSAGGGAWRRRGGEGAAVPETLFGLDIAPESLPDDVPAAARDLFAAGRPTEALGLLYRGALARLAARREVAASWTEEECVRHLAGALDGDGADWFRRLAGAWQAAAYAHRPPDGERFGGLAGGWSRHLEAAG